MRQRSTRLYFTPATEDAVAGWRLFDAITGDLIEGVWDTDSEALTEIDRRRYDVTVEPRWAIPRIGTEVERLFPAGTKVRHANPDLADWEGVIEPITRGKSKGQVIRWFSDGDPCVRVRWSDDGQACWHGATAIVPA